MTSNADTSHNAPLLRCKTDLSLCASAMLALCIRHVGTINAPSTISLLSQHISGRPGRPGRPYLPRLTCLSHPWTVGSITQLQHLHAGVQGVYCGEQPYKVLAMCVVVIAVLCLGLLRFQVETDPQRLWVGAGSLAAKEKAQYEVTACTTHSA